MTFLKTFFSRVFDYWLDKSRIIKDLVEAVKNLTKSAQDLTKANVALTRLVIEDREALAELYNLHADILAHLTNPGTGSKADTSTKLVKATTSKLTPIEQITAEKAEKKKNNTSN